MDNISETFIRKKLLVIDIEEPTNCHYHDQDTIGEYLFGKNLELFRLFICKIKETDSNTLKLLKEKEIILPKETDYSDSIKLQQIIKQQIIIDALSVEED